MRRTLEVQPRSAAGWFQGRNAAVVITQLAGPGGGQGAARQERLRLPRGDAAISQLRSQRPAAPAEARRAPFGFWCKSQSHPSKKVHTQSPGLLPRDPVTPLAFCLRPGTGVPTSRWKQPSPSTHSETVDRQTPGAGNGSGSTGAGLWHLPSPCCKYSHLGLVSDPTQVTQETKQDSSQELMRFAL